MIDLTAFAGHTSGPWAIEWQEVSHASASAVCRGVCGKGAIPSRVWRVSPEDVARTLKDRHAYGWHDWDDWDGTMHGFPPVHAIAIRGADGETIFTEGVDYDDGGYGPDSADANLIAAAPDLLNEVFQLRAALEAERKAKAVAV